MLKVVDSGWVMFWHTQHTVISKSEVVFPPITCHPFCTTLSCWVGLPPKSQPGGQEQVSRTSGLPGAPSSTWLPGPVHPLQVFRLTRSKVDDDKARILIRSLLDHPALEELDLSHNLIGDRGARAAAKLLSHSRLRVLSLANNQVRAPGAQSLAHALAHNTNLLSLNLRLNCIEDEGGQALAHALQTNKCLTTLHLGGNELSEPTASLLSQVLSINTTLTSINLTGNHIGLVSRGVGAGRAAGRPCGLGRRVWNPTAARHLRGNCWITAFTWFSPQLCPLALG